MWAHEKQPDAFPPLGVEKQGFFCRYFSASFLSDEPENEFHLGIAVGQKIVVRGPYRIIGHHPVAFGLFGMFGHILRNADDGKTCADFGTRATRTPRECGRCVRNNHPRFPHPPTRRPNCRAHGPQMRCGGTHVFVNKHIHVTRKPVGIGIPVRVNLLVLQIFSVFLHRKFFLPFLFLVFAFAFLGFAGRQIPTQNTAEKALF